MPLLRSIYRKIYSLLGNRGLTRFGPIARANQAATGMLKKKENSVVVDGNTIYLLEKDSAISRALPLLGEVEPTTTKAFKKIVGEGDTVLDIGANIGYYTLLFARRVGVGGKVFAFEPDPVNLKVLRKNVSANGYRNVTIVDKAVSDREGKTKFYLANASDSNSIYEFSSGLRSIDVETVSLDAYLEGYGGEINLVKMDIQGAEYAALQGMRGLLAKNPKAKIIAEFEPALLRDCGVEPAEYLDLLGELGFEIYDISEKRRRVERKTKEAIMKEYSQKGDCTNLYCVPRGTSGKIEL